MPSAPVHPDTHEFKPVIASEENIAEFTIKAAVAGVVFGVFLGAANCYLGLKAGLTVATSIPISVLTIAVFRALRVMGTHSTILESNISQSIGSASSCVASGVIFTVPALFLWGANPSLLSISLLALTGGILGTVMMIPLRRFLIVGEHKTLPYPEGTACARVLTTAQGTGAQSRPLFIGMALGGVHKLCTGFLHLWKESPRTGVIGLPKAQIGIEATPALLGVGYILGPKIAAVMVAGAGISWVVLMPLINWLGTGRTEPLYPETTKLIVDMTSTEIWSRYIRYLGAGAVAMAGIFTIVRSFPMMVQSFRLGMRGMKHDGTGGQAAIPRVERDLSFRTVGLIVLAVIAAVALIPHLVGGFESFGGRLVVALAITIFAFFFVTVSSRIVGLIGVSSNPTSGMTILTLLGTSLVFYALGWTDAMGRITALSVGTVICVAASTAGDMSQDLKTGYLVGATPYKQQIGQLLGVLTSAWAVAYSVTVLYHAYGFGTEALPAPQATLMKTVIEGVLSAKLPWTFVLIGAGMTVVAELFRIRSLPFAVGLYLPLSTMTPIFAGGLVRWLVERRHGHAKENADRERGILFSSGLIAGEGLAAVALAGYVYLIGKPKGVGDAWLGVFSDWMALGLFALLGYLLWRRWKTDQIPA